MKVNCVERLERLDWPHASAAPRQIDNLLLRGDLPQSLLPSVSTIISQVACLYQPPECSESPRQLARQRACGWHHCPWSLEVVIAGTRLVVGEQVAERL